MADPDWTDPCAVVIWLEPQLAQVATGKQVVMTQRGENRTEFTQANYANLLAFYRQKVSECAAKQGVTTGRRRPFIAG